MKRSLPALVIMSLLMACQGDPATNDHTADLRANISGIQDSTKVYLYGYVDEKMDKLDSLYTTDGQFAFEFATEQAVVVRMKIGAQRSFELFVEPGTLELTAHVDSLENMVFTGSQSHGLYDEFQDTYNGFNNKMRDLYPQYTIAEETGDSLEMARIDSAYEDLYEGQKAYLMDFIHGHTESPVAAFIDYRYLYDTPLNELQEIYANYSPEVQMGEYGQMMSNRIGVLEKVAIGQPAVNIALLDPDSNIRSIEDFRGSYLLVDFWASWCGPCRAENPNVVRMYNEYHDKGFDILGVSFDQSRERWLGAIEDDSLTWTHISDLKGWDCEGGKLYGIRSIPATVLIDPDGMIIAKNLRGEELEAKLQELFPTEG